LPDHAIDRWGLLEPRAAWLTVLLIAGLGFANYILWKLFGARGIEFAGFLGGLVNSTVTVTELASRVKNVGDGLARVAHRGIMLSVAAMAARNALLLAMLWPPALAVSGVSLGLMLVASFGFAFVGGHAGASITTDKQLDLKSPFSLRSAIKFGAIFLLLKVAGTVAQVQLGSLGFYAVSVIGGIVSSASAVAVAAALAASGELSSSAAGFGAVLASLASAAVNVLLVARFAGSRSLLRWSGSSIAAVLAIGLAGALLAAYYFNDSAPELNLPR
jgi:uncharacterized membrane protein (DUF4010 family)